MTEIEASLPSSEVLLVRGNNGIATVANEEGKWCIYFCSIDSGKVIRQERKYTYLDVAKIVASAMVHTLGD